MRNSEDGMDLVGMAMVIRLFCSVMEIRGLGKTFVR